MSPGPFRTFFSYIVSVVVLLGICKMESFHRQQEPHERPPTKQIGGGLEPHVLGVLIALLVILLTLVVFAVWSRRRNARRGVIVVGLSDAGKTLIFCRLLHSKFVNTHTSIRENIGNFNTPNGSLRIIDIPGHERLRNRFFDQYKSIARGIIFVIDSLCFQKEIRDVAEYLYTLLSDPVVMSNHPSFLILCNKQDQTMAKGSKVIQAMLEKEMNMLRVTKLSQLESTNDTVSSKFLGKQGEDFKFSHLMPICVDIAECAAYNNDAAVPADLDALKQWLSVIS